jgi:hypothetical protein
MVNPDLVPEPEVTETPPDVVESAAPPVEEAAVAPPATGPSQGGVEETPEPRYVTLEQLEEREAQIREQARLDAAEDIRRENQIRNRRAEIQREAEERAENEARREIRLALQEQGITADDTTVLPILKGYTRAYEGRIRESELRAVQDGMTVATAAVLKMPTPKDIDLTDEVVLKADKLEPYVRQMYDRARSESATDLRKQGWTPPDQLSKVVDAEIKRRGLAAREGTESFGNVEGTPETGDNDLTPERYAAMTPGQQRQLASTPEGKAVINAMTRKYVRVPERT